MEEYKFRIFDKESKKMLYPTEHISYCPMSDDWVVKAETYFENSSGRWKTKLSELYGVIPMQYTGCKDKDRVEIYEGDIVKHCSNNETVGTIIYDTGTFRTDDEEGTPLHNNYYYLIVTGNIHEHM